MLNRIQILNTLRKIGLVYILDKLKFKLEKSKNKNANQKFKSENPNASIPPDYLMYESFQINYSKYYFGGKETAKWILELIGKYKNLEGICVLDWGCGPGRVIRHMPEILNNKSKFYGTDYNKESINWCKKNIQDVKFNHNNLEAKLPYIDNYFEAIYGLSIITHLSKEMHFNWLKELLRTLKIEGILIITTQGNNFKTKLSKNERKRFENGELIVRRKTKEGHRTFAAFHPDKFLKTLFNSNEIKILDRIVISPKNKSYTPQDTWILKKRKKENDS